MWRAGWCFSHPTPGHGWRTAENAHNAASTSREVQKTTWGFSPSFVFDIQSPVIQKQLETNVKMLHYSWSTPGHWLSGASFTNTKSSRGRSYTGVVDRRRDVDGTKGQQEHEVLMSLDERRMCGLPGQRAGCLGNASLLSQSVFRPSG